MAASDGYSFSVTPVTRQPAYYRDIRDFITELMQLTKSIQLFG
jgi:hypothetical protein